jgi:hypothetical protein
VWPSVRFLPFGFLTIEGCLQMFDLALNLLPAITSIKEYIIWVLALVFPLAAHPIESG